MKKIAQVFFTWQTSMILTVVIIAISNVSSISDVVKEVIFWAAVVSLFGAGVISIFNYIKSKQK